MNLERFCIKFLAKEANLGESDEASLIHIFQDWIRDRALDGVLIDVADYSHVPEGPGVMLVSHEINYAMDKSEGQIGVYAQLKINNADSHKEAILDLVKSTAKFGQLLESDERIKGKISLEGGKFIYMTNDRLRAPNNEETFQALKPDLEAAATSLYPGQTVTVTRIENDPRDRLSIMVEASEQTDLATLAKDS